MRTKSKFHLSTELKLTWLLKLLHVKSSEFILVEKNFEGKPVDVWAAGVTLHQMVYNKLPFPSRDMI
jgi:hypothetical protein